MLVFHSGPEDRVRARMLQTSNLLKEQVLSFLSDITGVSPSRIHLNMTTIMSTGDATVIKTDAILDSSSDPADVSAYDAGVAFVQAWEDTGSAIYETDDLSFQVDATAQPMFTAHEDLGAEPDTPAPTPAATLPGEPVDTSPSVIPPDSGLSGNSNSITGPTDESAKQGFFGKSGLGATIGLAVGCVGAAALLFLGAYAVRRRQVFNTRGRSRSTLRVQATN